MSDKDHVTYFTSKFRAIQYRLPHWSDRNLRNSYHSSLAPHILNQFITSSTQIPDILAGLIAVAERLDCAYWANFKLTKANKSKDKSKRKDSSGQKSKKRKTSRENSNSNANSISQSNSNAKSSNNANSGTSTSKQSGSGKKKEPDYKKSLGADGKLLPKERERQISQGLCLLCGQPDHVVNDCPKKQKSESSSSTLAHATITVIPNPPAKEKVETKSK